MLVEWDAFKKLAYNSLEFRSNRTRQAIAEWDSANACTHKVVATFDGSAIVVNEDGHTFRMKLGNERDRLFVIRSEKIDGPKVWKEDEVADFLKSGISKTVDVLSSGGNASEHVASLMANSGDIDVVGYVIGRLQSLAEDNNLWCKYYSVNMPMIVRKTWWDQPLIEGRHRPVTDFNRLMPVSQDLSRRLDRLSDGFISAGVLDSVRITVSEQLYWLTKISRMEVDSRKYSDILDRLIECSTKADQVITYAEYLHSKRRIKP